MIIHRRNWLLKWRGLRPIEWSFPWSSDDCVLIFEVCHRIVRTRYNWIGKKKICFYWYFSDCEIFKSGICRVFICNFNSPVILSSSTRLYWNMEYGSKFFSLNTWNPDLFLVSWHRSFLLRNLEQSSWVCRIWLRFSNIKSIFVINNYIRIE